VKLNYQISRELKAEREDPFGRLREEKEIELEMKIGAGEP